VLAAILMSLVAAAPADASMAISGVTANPGRIGLYLWGSGPFTSVGLAERVHGRDVVLQTLTPPFQNWLGVGLNPAYYPNVVPWRCDRQTRSFLAIGHLAGGAVETAASSVRTPSCRERLDLLAPREVRARARVRVQVLDTFRLGGVSPRVCVQPPTGARRCRTIRLSGPAAAFAFTARAGHWVVTLTTGQQRIRDVVSAGVPPPAGTAPPPVVLATGDSEMQSVDAELSDDLLGRAQVDADVWIGTGLSTTFPVDWLLLPARQVRRFHPTLTVMFIGANDAFAMTTPGGAAVQCCGPPWIAEYARRVRVVTEAYLRGGSKDVVWLNVPYPQSPVRFWSVFAVDAALARGVNGLRHVAVVDIATAFTPRGVYRSSMPVNGRSVQVRNPDGVHLSPAGAAIAARDAIRELEHLRAL
jgi:lysophospholipase L1-like esterase